MVQQKGFGLLSLLGQLSSWTLWALVLGSVLQAGSGKLKFMAVVAEADMAKEAIQLAAFLAEVAEVQVSK